MTVDLEAASAGTGVSVATLYRWVKTGRLRTVSRRPVRVRLEDVDRARLAPRMRSLTGA